MEYTIQPSNSTTPSLGNSQFLFAGLAFFVAMGQSGGTLDAAHKYNIPPYIAKEMHKISPQDKPWEYVFNSVESSGFSHPSVQQEHDVIINFASRLFEKMHETPREFEKVFVENFWELLA